jgi:hypothetical protein
VADKGLKQVTSVAAAEGGEMITVAINTTDIYCSKKVI